MREQEMRIRVFRFLKARMRNMIMPATMGIGLAVGGCAKENAIPVYSAPLQDSGPPAQTDVLLSSDTQPAPSDSAAPGPDSAPPRPDSSAPRPDLASDAREVQVAADLAPDTGPDLVGRDTTADRVPAKDLAAPDRSPADVPARPDQAVAIDGGGIDTGTDLGSITKYGVPIPDAASEKAVVVPLYTAVFPDAAVGADTAGVRYAAVMLDAAPDLGLPATDYMAPFQS